MENENIKKPGKVGNFFFCLWVVIAMVIVQFVTIVAGLIPVAVMLRLQNPGSMAKYMEKYNDYLVTSPVMTYLELISVIVGIAVAGTWYYFGYVRKKKKAGCYQSVWDRLKRSALCVSPEPDRSWLRCHLHNGMTQYTEK